jgi:putative hydrolase of the HAD superfamily
MPLKSVFIDAGNTLLYEMPSRAAIYAEEAAAEGLELDAAATARRMRRAHQELPRELDGHFRYSEGWFRAYIARVFEELDGPRVEALTERLFARFADPATFRLFEGADELLSGLAARGLRVGVVSNWSDRLPGLLEGLGLAPRLDFALVSCLERCEKPEPEIFERALRRAGVAPEEALHAGDHPEKDVAGARRVGIEAVLVDHAGESPHVDAPRVRSLAELLALVEERAA